MADSISISYSWTREEKEKAKRYHYQHRGILKRVLEFSVAASSSFIGLFLPSFFVFIVCLLCQTSPSVAVTSAILFYILGVLLSQSVVASMLEGDTYTVALSEAGIQIDTGESIVSIDWKDAEHFVKTPEGFLLYVRGVLTFIEPHVFLWLPFSGLQDGQTGSDVESFLRARTFKRRRIFDLRAFAIMLGILFCALGMVSFVSGHLLLIERLGSSLASVEFPIEPYSFVQVDSMGRIFYGLETRSRIQVYDPQGRFIKALPIPAWGQFRFQLNSKDELIVKSAKAKKIYQFDRDLILHTTETYSGGYPSRDHRTYFEGQDGENYYHNNALFSLTRLYRYNGSRLSPVVSFSFWGWFFQFWNSMIFFVGGLFLFVSQSRFMEERKDRIKPV